MTEEERAISRTPESSLRVTPRDFPRENVDEFIHALKLSKQELDIARQQFENVVDPRLIDHVVFRLGAAERHFSYLFQLARQWDIEVKGIRWDLNESE